MGGEPYYTHSIGKNVFILTNKRWRSSIPDVMAQAIYTKGLGRRQLK